MPVLQYRNISNKHKLLRFVFPNDPLSSDLFIKAILSNTIFNATCFATLILKYVYPRSIPIGTQDLAFSNDALDLTYFILSKYVLEICISKYVLHTHENLHTSTSALKSRLFSTFCLQLLVGSDSRISGRNVNYLNSH